MSIELRLPQIADDIVSAKVVAWLKEEGDAVRAGEAIAEVETDKTNVELEAPATGVLQKIHVPVGASAAVGELLAEIDEREYSLQRAGGDDEIDPPTRRPHEPKPPPVVTSAAAEPNPLKSVAGSVELEPATVRDEIAATPLAARMAQVAGLDLASIQPSELFGLITKADVERALGTQAPPKHSRAAPETLAPAASSTAGTAEIGSTLARGFEVLPLSAMRRVTARRLQESKQTVPHFYLQTDCVVDSLLNLRARVNQAGDVKITVTGLLVMIVARALRTVGVANSSWTDDGVRVYDSIDIAVAVNTPQGLITPIVRESDRKALGAIACELKELGERARNGQLKPNEYTGGTFTISNLGMFGVTSITPIINPPQSGILGIGAIELEAIVRDGEIVVGQVMTCTLAADHRAIDGVTGAKLLSEIRRLIEEPMSLV